MTKTYQYGFTMVELIVGIVLFGISIPLVGVLIDSLGQFTDRAKDQVTVNSVVENKIEALRSKGFNGVNNGTTDFSSELPTTLPSPRSASYAVTSLNPSLKSVTVTITVKGKQSEYKTYLGELGVAQY